VRVFDDDEVEPAAAPFAPCGDSDFVADGLEFVTEVVVEFGGEGARADARGVLD
jgi:hypothetical protein